jgi:hypothetical protein
MSTEFARTPFGFELHPFDIEYPAEYHRLAESDLDIDMNPFDCWEFFFDNGWGASVLDAHNEPGEFHGQVAKMWILDFGAWETIKGVKRFHHCRHPEVPDDSCLVSMSTDQINDLLHLICRLPYRTYSASKVTHCTTCSKWILRSDQITFDERVRPYHLACI